MRCYALAASINKEAFHWYFSQFRFNLNSFHAPLKRNWHCELMAICNAMKENSECSQKIDKYPFVLNIKKTETSAVIILTDEVLTKEELANLFTYIAEFGHLQLEGFQEIHFDIADLIKNFDSYLTKDKLNHLEDAFFKIAQEMMKTIELEIKSQQNIDHLLAETNLLVNTYSFKPKPIKKQIFPFIKTML
ncbi:MAG: hypothetical protein LCH30_04430 [Proteobacteria bacterium]|nr:hypothetical protein [Pseudomonadota bacterium]